MRDGEGAGWKIQRRPQSESRAWHRVAAVALGIFASLAFGVIVSGSSLVVFEDLWLFSFGSPTGIEDVATLSIPLILTGLAAAIPLRIGLWNIGGDGQLFLGAWGAFAVGELFPDMDGSLLIPLMFVAAAFCAAAWSIIPAIARVYLNVNEIISTLMFNFIAASWVIYWAGSKWGEQASAGSVKSESVPKQSILESIQVGDYLIPISFVFAVVFGALVWLFLRRSVFGYEMSIIGSSPRAATYAGMPTKRIMLIVFALGGVAAGLAGVTEMLTNVQRYGPALSNNTGYTGVVVAVLAGGFGPQLLAMALVFAIISIAGGIMRAERARVRHVRADADLRRGRPGPAPRADRQPGTRRPDRGAAERRGGRQVRDGLVSASIATAILAATPVLIAATGELLAEIVGVYNIGIEGAMLIGALGAFIGVQQADTASGSWPEWSPARSPRWSSPSRSSCKADVVVGGLALVFLGFGLTGLIGTDYVQETASATIPLGISRCSRTSPSGARPSSSS